MLPQMKILFLTAIIGVTDPAMASTLPDLKSLSDDSLIALYEKASSADQPNICNEVVPILAELMSRPSIEGNLQERKTAADFDCALQENRWGPAYRLLPRVEAYVERDLGSLGFLVALFSDHYNDAAQRLIALAKAKDADELLSIDDQQIYRLLGELWTAKQFEQRGAVAQALLASPHVGKLPDNLQSFLASAIIGEEARTGKRSPARFD